MSDTTSINPLICSSCRANLVCPSCANAMADYLKTINTDAEVQRLREIAAKQRKTLEQVRGAARSVRVGRPVIETLIDECLESTK